MLTFSADSAETAALIQFKNRRVMHAKLEEALASLSQIGNPSLSDSIVALVGPSGVGKSVIIEEFVRRVNIASEHEIAVDPSIVPALWVRLPAPIHGDFNWKDAFIRILERFNEPLIRQKFVARLQTELDGEIVTNLSRLVAEELRRAVRNCVVNRKTKVIAFDEASHLFIARSRSKHLLQLELVKSLVNDVAIGMVLASTYDLVERENFHAQLLRRTEVVHFGRYTVEELAPGNPYGQSFRDTVYTLLHSLPVDWDKRLIDHADYFLMNCVGCIGLLKRWLQHALEYALTHDISIDANVLKRTAYPNYKLITMFKEAKAGEELLVDIKATELARELGFSHTPSLTFKARDIEDATPAMASAPKRRQRPGKRNPGRDAVGGHFE
jgi:hypothetical protein